MSNQQPPSQPDGDDPSKDRKSRTAASAYLRYSGMAFEMAAVIFIFTFAGKKLDGYLHTPKPYFTISGALLGTLAALYLTLKDLIFPKKDE